MSIGHNQPPSELDLAQETADTARQWLADNPVIADEEVARGAKLIRDRLVGSIDCIDKERDAQVRPLNTQVRAINDRYRQGSASVTSALSILQGRLTQYAVTIEREKKALAQAAAARSAASAKSAAEAISAAHEAEENASVGELEVDVVAAADVANAAIRQAEKDARAAARAEKDAHIKIGGGFGRALTLRSKEILVLDDPALTLQFLALTPGITQAILTAARAYRRLNGELPPGISIKHEREI